MKREQVKCTIEEMHVEGMFGERTFDSLRAKMDHIEQNSVQFMAEYPDAHFRFEVLQEPHSDWVDIQIVAIRMETDEEFERREAKRKNKEEKKKAKLQERIEKLQAELDELD